MTGKRMWIAAILAALLIGFPPDGSGAVVGVEGAVRRYIETQMPWPPGSVRVDFLAAELGKSPPGKDTTLRVENAGTADFLGDTVFLVRHYRSGSLVRTQSVRTRIEVMRDVVVTTRGLTSGTVLTAEDLQVTRRWVRRISPQALTSLDEAEGKRLTLQVAAGTELLATMLREVPLVRRGKMVKIVLAKGPMRITTVGLSEEDGVSGSIVRVRNVTSNRIIHARVLSDSLVAIDF